MSTLSCLIFIDNLINTFEYVIGYTKDYEYTIAFELDIFMMECTLKFIGTLCIFIHVSKRSLLIIAPEYSHSLITVSAVCYIIDTAMFIMCFLIFVVFHKYPIFADDRDDYIDVCYDRYYALFFDIT